MAYLRKRDIAALSFLEIMQSALVKFSQAILIATRVLRMFGY